VKTPTPKGWVEPAKVDPVANAEATRWHLWEVVSLVDRQRAVGVAGMAKERASAPIASFSDAERERVRAALCVHIAQMEFIARCMAPAKTTLQGFLH
jgi:hypothetical protein